MLAYWYRTTRDKDFQELDSFKKGCWIYAEDPNDAEQALLIDKYKLDPGLLEDALDQDEVPRVEREDDLTYLYARFPYVDEHKQISTTPVLFVIGPDTFLTVSRLQIPKFETVVSGREDMFTTQRLKLMLQLLDIIVDEYERRLTGISKRILSTRNRLKVEQIGNRDFIEFVNIEDALNDFMAALVPSSTILKRLLIGRYLTMHEDDKELIEDLLLSNEQSIEGCKSNIKTIVSIREAYSTIATNNLNQIIRVLTSITVVLTIPTIIGTIYGMNVVLPLGTNPGAVWLLLGFMLITSALLLVFFRYKKWL